MEGLYTYNKTIQVSDKDVGVYSCVAANRGIYPPTLAHANPLTNSASSLSDHLSRSL